MHEAALQVIAEGKIDAGKLISRVVPLEGIVQAIRSSEAGEVLKVVVDPWL